MSDCTTAMCNIGISSWGYRIEVANFKGYDVTRGSQYLVRAMHVHGSMPPPTATSAPVLLCCRLSCHAQQGQSYMSNSLFRINTTNSINGWSGWPWGSTEQFWNSFPIKVRGGRKHQRARASCLQHPCPAAAATCCSGL